FAAQALSGIRRFTATIGVEGKEDDLRFSIASDLGQILADGVKKAASAQLLAQRKLLEQKVDAFYETRAKDVQARAGALRKQLLAPLDRQQAVLEKQLQQAAARAVPAKQLEKALPKNLKGIFR